MRIPCLLLAIAAALAVGTCGCSDLQRRIALDRYVRGQLMVERGQLDEALAELAAAVEMDPKLSVAHAAIGDIHRHLGHPELARDSYEAACRADPYAFRPHYNLGVMYQVLAEGTGIDDEARTLLRSAARVYLRAHTIRPEDYDTNLNLCACYYQLAKYSLSEQYGKAAIRTNRAAAAEAEKVADPKERQALLAPINRLGAKAYSNLGLIYQQQKRFSEAIGAYNAALELDIDSPRIIMSLGRVYLRQGRLKPALNLLLIAAEKAPENPTVWEMVGVARFHMRDFAGSAEAFRKAGTLNPKSAFAFRGMGLALMSQFVLDPKKTKLRDEALVVWRTSLTIWPGQQDLARLLAKYKPEEKKPEPRPG